MMTDDIDPKKAYEIAQRLGRSKEESVNAPIYKPPPGRPQYEEMLHRYKYTPDAPTPENMQLEDFEQRHIYSVAMRIAKVFGPDVQPIPDAMYNLIPQPQRASQLFCVVSRSDIRRIDSNRIAWPAIQVVIKEIPIIKIIATLDFAKDIFDIWQIIFWRNDVMDYEKPITRGSGQPIPSPMIIEFISRYKRLEGIQ